MLFILQKQIKFPIKINLCHKKKFPFEIAFLMSHATSWSKAQWFEYRTQDKLERIPQSSAVSRHCLILNIGTLQACFAHSTSTWAKFSVDASLRNVLMTLQYGRTEWQGDIAVFFQENLKSRGTGFVFKIHNQFFWNTVWLKCER